jgi:transcriptional regulator with XRE-family HTH domain
MLQTHLATLRRFSTCPKQADVAKKLRAQQSRVSAVEAGRVEASREYVERLSKVLEMSFAQVWLAHLLDRKAFYLSACRHVEKLISEARGSAVPARRKSA